MTSLSNLFFITFVIWLHLIFDFSVVENSVNILQMNIFVHHYVMHSVIPTFLCISCAYIQLSSVSFLCPGVVYQTGSEWPVASLELQPSPKWNGFKLRTFDSDSVSTLSSCGPGWSFIRTRGARWPSPALILGKCSVYYESLVHRPQNKRWDHVWVGWFLKNPLRWWRVMLNQRFFCWLVLWCNTDWPFWWKWSSSFRLFLCLSHVFPFKCVFFSLSFSLTCCLSTHKYKNTLILYAAFCLNFWSPVSSSAYTD